MSPVIMSQPEYTLYYFDVRGLAEPIRLLFKMKSIQFTDHRIPFETCPAQIPSEIKEMCPFGQVPILKVDNEILSQSQAILRFLAHKYDLAGKGDMESAKCDEFADAARDYWNLFMPIWHTEDADKKNEIKKSAMEKGREQFLTKFNQRLDQNGGHLVGKEMTWADIYVTFIVDNLEKGLEVDLSSEFSALKALREKVYSTSGIKEWIAERPQTKF